MSEVQNDKWPWGLEEGWIILDEKGDHLLRITSMHDEGLYGFTEAHRTATGEWCAASIARPGKGAGQPEWDVISEDPLTLSPSILCRRCGNHGFIREGKWVEA